MAYSKYHKAYLIKSKQEAFDILGWECVACGETDVRTLQIDHIKAVMHTGEKRQTTWQIYKEIRDNPEEAKKKFQTLCANCNWRKRFVNHEWKRRKPTPADRPDPERIYGQEPIQYLKTATPAQIKADEFFRSLKQYIKPQT